MRFIRDLRKWLFILAAIGFVAAAVFDDTVWLRRLTGEKFYEEQELQVEARLLPNGDMRVKETRVMAFHGGFSRYRRQIPAKGFGEMRILRVAESAIDYQRVSAANGRPVGKYIFTTGREAGSEVYNVELYFAAKDEARTFVIEYLITDAVKVHADTAEFYWQFIGRKRSVDIGRMTVSLDLPPGARADEIRVWGHGPLRGEVRKISATQLGWQTTDLPKSRFLEGRVTFPARLVPQAKVLTGRTALPGIVAEEQRWADERAAEQRKNWAILAASAGIGLVGCLAAWWIYRRYGRKYRGPLELDYYRELPGDYSPAEAGYLVELGSLKPQAVSASIMDLARRGYLRLESATTPEAKDVLVRRLRAPDDKLRPHELQLLDFLFRQVGQGQTTVWFSALKIFRKAEQQAMADFVTAFRSEVAGSVAAMGYFEVFQTGRKIGKAVFYIGLAGVVGFYTYKLFAPMLAAMTVTGAFLLVWWQSRSLTQPGQWQYDQWQAFRRFLKDFSNLDRAQLPQLILWEHYLVYATALGVATEVIRQLPVVYPELSRPDSQFGYYWGGMHHSRYDADGGHSSSFAGLASVSEIMSSLDDSWSSAVSGLGSAGGGSSDSGGGGDGGGFSGGGGDGGGGGGGDAD